MLNAIEHPKGGWNTERRESTSVQWNWGKFDFNRVFKLGLAKEASFRHTDMRKIEMLGRRNNVLKNIEIEKPCTYMDGGINLICLGCQVERKEAGHTVFHPVWTKVVRFRARYYVYFTEKEN